jgi:hypothetical protein
MIGSQLVRRDATHMRQGACHSCGWNQSLRKVSGQQAASFRRATSDNPRVSPRWLCDDCIADLTAVEHELPAPVYAGVARLVTAGPVRHRSVA